MACFELFLIKKEYTIKPKDRVYFKLKRLRKLVAELNGLAGYLEKVWLLA